jgi:DNA-directed RNA polymerase beta subunit
LVEDASGLLLPPSFKNKMLTHSNFYLSDFVQLQIKSFQLLLQKGIIEEFSKRNPIRDSFLEIFFYSELYQLSPPEFTPREAILKGQSFSSKLYLPVQLTDKKTKTIFLKWIFLGELPIMTKRGHFILNGAPQVIVNQLIRSPGIYYQEKTISLFAEEKEEKPFTTFKRYYADFICLRGSLLRIEIDKDKNIWAKFKKGPKLPILVLLYAMGLTQGMLFKHIIQPTRLLTSFELEISDYVHKATSSKKPGWSLRGSVAEAGGGELAKFNLLCPALALRARENQSYQSEICGHKQTLPWRSRGEKKKSGRLRGKPVGLITSPQQAWREIADLFNLQTGYNQIDVAVPSGNNIRSSLPRTRGNYMAGPDKAKLVSFRRCFSTAVQKLVTKSAELWKLLIKPKQYF